MSNSLPAITLDELERLIKLLGLLASSHDPEALVAARMAVKWLRDHQTDWRTLLTPEPEQAVTGVAVAGDRDLLLDQLEAAHQADRVTAYRNGFQAGLQAMAAQVKAQASTTAPQPQGGPGWAAGGFGGALGGNPTQPPPAAPQAPPKAPLGGYPAGSWQAVCVELLDRDAQGIPGVFRGSREQDFVASLLARGWRTLTAPQEQWLRDIAGRSGLAW